MGKSTTIMSNCKDPENRSKKACCCGGHNLNNSKSNLQHNGTRRRKQYRDERKALEDFHKKIVSNQQGLPPEFAEVIEDNFWDLI